MKIIDDLRDYEPHDMYDLAVALGMETTGSSAQEVLAELFVRIEDEVNAKYQLCPIDKYFNPIHVGDNLEGLGEVMGIGDDCVYAIEINNDIYNGHAVFPAGAYKLQNADLEGIVRAIAADARSGSLDDNGISRYVSAIEVTCNAR